MRSLKSLNDAQTFYLETLGCPKNLVDSEKIAYLFKSQGYKKAESPDSADIITVNTCGFILQAKEESIDTILNLAEYKKSGRCKLLIVTGCLVELYEEELRQNLPEVDHFFNLHSISNLSRVLSAQSGTKMNKISPAIDRMLLTPPHYAYLRISDGCNNHCSYCLIPRIRGGLRSRPIPELVQEAKTLARQGVKELILIAQDIGNYGQDLYGRSCLQKLLAELDKISSLHWIRLLYLNPQHISEALLSQIAESDKICHYLDIPIQHINDEILRRMNRKISRKEILQKLDLVRKMLPDASIRTSIIVGFPGETKSQFEELLNFIQSQKFQKLGCFLYSQEEGTPAASFYPQVPEKEKKAHYNRLMGIQQDISHTFLSKFIGKKITVIVDRKIGVKTFECRTEFDAPEVDGVVYLEAENVDEGQLHEVEIIDSLEYDLIGRLTTSKGKKYLSEKEKSIR
ncbi:MAG: 30S ribosomal protein S12 methylthiotransferase RimO [Candidatus Cloacimonadia bacterium]